MRSRGSTAGVDAPVVDSVRCLAATDDAVQRRVHRPTQPGGGSSESIALDGFGELLGASPVGDVDELEVSTW